MVPVVRSTELTSVSSSRTSRVPSSRASSFPSAPNAGDDHPLASLEPTERGHRAERGEGHWNALGCAGCHIAGQENPGVVPVALEELGARYDIARLTVFLAAPTPPMPTVALDADDRADLAVYLLERF
jgi:hypothetical protein